MSALLMLPKTLSGGRFTAPTQSFGELLSSPSAYYDPAAWKYTAFSKLHEFETSPSPMQQAENLLVANSTAMFARAILDKVRVPDLPNPSVCPVAGESLGIVWTVGSKQLEAIFDADASGSYVLVSDGEVREDGDITRETVGDFERALRSILIA